MLFGRHRRMFFLAPDGDTGTPPATPPAGDPPATPPATPPAPPAGDPPKDPPLTNAEAAELRKLRKEAKEREEADKAREREKMSEIERRDAENADLRKQNAELLRKTIGLEFGLPAEIAGRLKGDDEAAMRADAEALKALFGDKKPAPEPGSTGSDKAPTPPAPGNPEIAKLESDLQAAIKAGQALKVMEIEGKLRTLKAAAQK